MKNYIPLVFIFIFGVILRFQFLDSIPVGFHRDEAFLGYNAYSIVKTGRDISGTRLPIHLQSFLFSPAGYSYASILPLYIFGISVFSVRFASAFFGSLTVLVLYAAVSEILKVFRTDKNGVRHISLLSAFFLSISPWHINLSRTATENSIVTFFVVLGIYFYFRYIRTQHTSLFIGSYVSFFITLFIYQAPRAFLPLFIPFLHFFSWRIMKWPHRVITSCLYLLLIIVPIYVVLSSATLSTRIRTLNIFGFPQTKIMINEWITADGMTNIPYVFTRVYHNKITGYFLTFTENLANHFSYGFLFSDKGMPDRYRIPSSGLLYVFEIPLIAIAFISLFSRTPQLGIFLIIWICIAFSGTAMTFDDIPNLQRTLFAEPAFAMLSAIGIYTLFHLRIIMRWKKTAIVITSGVMLYSFGFYILQYYSYGKIYRPWYRQQGYKELVSSVTNQLSGYSSAEITNREGSPTIFFLFYTAYNPQLFQNETKNINTIASDHISFGKYKFSEEECPLRVDPVTQKLTGKKGILYVNSGLCKQIPPGTRLLKDIHRIEGSTAFRLLEVE